MSLRGRLSPPEIFHEILEHRWYMSEAAGRDVGTTAAARSYFDTVLPAVPQPLRAPGGDGMPVLDADEDELALAAATAEASLADPGDAGDEPAWLAGG